MRLGGTGESEGEQVHVPVCVGKTRKTGEVWVSHRKQEKGPLTL